MTGKRLDSAAERLSRHLTLLPLRGGMTIRQAVMTLPHDELDEYEELLSRGEPHPPGSAPEEALQAVRERIAWRKSR